MPLTFSTRASKPTRKPTRFLTACRRSWRRFGQARSNAASMIAISFTRRHTSPTHKLEVVGSQALVGSSNFSVPGLTKNIELNVQIQSAREVAQLQDWFEAHWKDAKEITEDVIETISRHTRLYTPFDVYAKALQEFFRGHELTATEWDETRSKMFPKLDRYQKEAYWALMKIARQHGGAFLCDGVGLGKTFVGLLLIERLVSARGQARCAVRSQGNKRGRVGAASSGMAAAYRWGRRQCRLQQSRSVQPHRPWAKGQTFLNDSGVSPNWPMPW